MVQCLYVRTDDDRNPLRAVTYVSNDFAATVKKRQFIFRLGGKRLHIVFDILEVNRLLNILSVALLFVFLS